MTDRRTFLRHLGGLLLATTAAPYVAERAYFFGGWAPGDAAPVQIVSARSALSEYGAFVKVSDVLQQDDVSGFAVQHLYDRRLLERMMANLPLDQIVVPQTPENWPRSNAIRWRQLDTLTGVPVTPWTMETVRYDLKTGDATT